MSIQCVITRFCLMPESGCSGAVIPFSLYRSEFDTLCNAVELATDPSGDLYIPVFNVFVSRDGLTLSLNTRDGLVPLTIELMEWRKAWELMTIGSDQFNGVEAINKYRCVVERIESGMKKSKGERGLHVQDRGKRENLVSEVLSRRGRMTLLQAVNRSLEVIAEEDLQASYRAAVRSIRLADNEITKAERVRALRRDVTTGIRKIIKAAEGSKQS